MNGTDASQYSLAWCPPCDCRPFETLASVAVIVVLTALAVACVPATNRDKVTDATGEEREVERPYTYSEKLALVVTTTWDAVLRPRRPAAPSGYRNWVDTLHTSTPLMLTGLAVAVAFRAAS